MPVIPPWLAVNPSDFVKSAEAGAQLGTQRSKIATDANLDTARMQSAERMHGQSIAARAQEAAAEMAMARERAKAAEAVKRWETGMELQLAHEKMGQQAGQQENALASLNAFRTNQLQQRAAQAMQNAKTSAQQLQVQKEFHDQMVALGHERNAILKEKQAAENRSPLQDAANSPPPQASFSVLKPWTWFRGSPATPAPPSNTVPVGPPVSAPAISPPGVQPGMLREGARFIQKSTGQKGMIRNGQFVPDEQSEPESVPYSPDYSMDEAAFMQ